MKNTLLISCVALSLLACSPGGASSSGASNSASSGGAAYTPSFGVAAGAVEPDSTPRPAIAVTLGADGSVRSRVENLGRFEGNRFLLPSGEEVFRLEADGTVAMPWRQPSQTLSLRFTAAGLEVTTTARHLLTIDESGVYHAESEPGGGRFTPYTPALRDTALMLRMLPMVVLMYGFAHAPTPTATPAPEAAPAS